jgi:hypothetical protein
MLEAVIRVELLLIALAGPSPVALVLLRVRRDVGHGAGQRVRVTRPEQHAVGSRRDQLSKRAVPGGDRGRARRHGLDDHQAERLLPDRRRQDRAGP